MYNSKLKLVVQTYGGFRNSQTRLLYAYFVFTFSDIGLDSYCSELSAASVSCDFVKSDRFHNVGRGFSIADPVFLHFKIRCCGTKKIKVKWHIRVD